MPGGGSERENERRRMSRKGRKREKEREAVNGQGLNRYVRVLAQVKRSQAGVNRVNHSLLRNTHTHTHTHTHIQSSQVSCAKAWKHPNTPSLFYSAHAY